jgi:putative aldouronate transport system substrate-binding protein
MKHSELLPDGEQRATLGTNRRVFLRLVAATSLGLLAACGTLPRPTTSGSSPPGAGNTKLNLPAQMPIQGLPAPDLQATAAGLQHGYLTFPKNLFKSVAQAPGLGGDVTALYPSGGKAVPTPLDQNPAWQEVNKQLNVNFKPQLFQTTDQPAKFATMAAGGDYPDLFAWVSASPVISDLPKFLAAAAADLTPFVSGDAIKAYPNLAAFPSAAWRECIFDGAIRAVPVMEASYVRYVWFINQTRWDAIGAQQPKNADDFTRILKELTRPDSNQYGIISSAYGFQYATPQLSMFRAPNNWAVDTGGKFIKDMETEEYKAALGYVRDLYAAGVFYPDPTANLTNMFMGGQAAVTCVGWRSYQLNFWDAGLAQDPPMKVRVLHPFSHDGGTPIWHKLEGNHGMTPIKQSSPQRVQELLGVLNYMAAPFGSEEALLLQYGVQGVDFNLDANGNPILTTKGNSDYLSTAGLMPAQDVLFDAKDPQFAQVAFADEQSFAPYFVSDPSYGLYSATYQAKSSQLNQKIYDGVSDIVAGRTPLSALDQLLSDWKTAGGDSMRMEYQQAYEQTQNLH